MKRCSSTHPNVSAELVHSNYMQEVIPDWTFETVREKLSTFYKLMNNVEQDPSLKAEHKDYLFKAILDTNADDLIRWEKHRHEAEMIYTTTSNSKELTVNEN